MVKKMISFRCPSHLQDLLSKEHNKTNAMIEALEIKFGLNDSSKMNIIEKDTKNDFLVFFKLFAKNAKKLDITQDEKEKIKDIQRRLKNE